MDGPDNDRGLAGRLSSRSMRLPVALIAAVLAATAAGAFLWMRLGTDASQPPTLTQHLPDVAADPVGDQSDGQVRRGETPTITTGTTATSGMSATTPSVAEPEAGAIFRKAPVIAYFREGEIWISDEEGKNQREVAPIPDGLLALSPDGKTIAVVRSQRLHLVDVATGKIRSVGDAKALRPVWLADSSVVLYSARSTQGIGPDEIRMLEVSARGAQKLASGRLPAAAADGTIAWLPDVGTERMPSGNSFINVRSPNGRTSTITVSAPGEVTALDVSLLGIVFATAADDESSTSEIWTVGFDGTGLRRILDAGIRHRPFGFSELTLCPGGTRVMAAITGDDGYSRAKVIELSTGQTTSLTARRDTYPVGWTSDGRSVLFVEGNAFQGEATALMRASADGTGRRPIVHGADVR